MGLRKLSFAFFLLSATLVIAAPAHKICKETSAAAAESFGLHYVTEAGKGITRQLHGKKFRYYDERGKEISRESEIERIAALGIPPAYKEVWISSDPESHIQATGIDEAGRLQYRYHPKWIEGRSERKFEHLIELGEALPDIRRAVETDIVEDGLGKARLLATIVRLLDRSLIRVGNQEYVEENGSYGLTTLLGSHVRVVGDKIYFKFRGKSGVDHEIVLVDAEVAAVVRDSRTGKSDPVFRYVDDEGNRHAVTSDAVNEYLRETTGLALSAKGFRTWGGTVAAAKALHELGPAADEKESHDKLKETFERVAARLGNTPSVSRESYVHPAIVEAYAGHSLIQAFRGARDTRYLTAEEKAVLKLLR